MIIINFIIDGAYIPLAGNFNPFVDENQFQITNNISSNKSHRIADLPSLSNIELEKAGPSLDIIDPHSHTHDNDSSVIEIAKHLLIQPSIDFLDAQLHNGEEHIHDKQAADLNDFQHWLKEQNETNQLNRFLLLQKEINLFYFNDTQYLNDKINRTIQELKATKKRTQHEL